MATITSNATGGGNWNAGASWAGGVAPADGDAVVIAAGDTITMNADLSAYTTGIAGITITSHATTPAKLVFKYDSDGTYYLKIKAATSIVGTNAAAFGQLLINGEGTLASTVDMPFGRKCTIEFLGTNAGRLDCTYLNVNLRCTEPTNKYIETYGNTWTATFAASTDRWTLSAGASTSSFPYNGTPAVLRAAPGATLPPEFTAGTTYFVVSKSGAAIGLSATYGGSAITSDSDSTGTIYITTGKYTLTGLSAGTCTWDGLWNSANAMRFVGSDLPSPLNSYMTLKPSSISGQNTGLIWYGPSSSINCIPDDAGSGSIVAYSDTLSAATGLTIAVLQDITGDSQWTTGSRVLLADSNGDDKQVDTIAATNANWITFTTSGPDSALDPLSRIYLCDRNVSLVTANTTSGATLILSPNSGCDFKCAMISGIINSTRIISGGSGYRVNGGVLLGAYNKIYSSVGTFSNTLFVQGNAGFNAISTPGTVVTNCEFAVNYSVYTCSYIELDSCTFFGGSQSIYNATGLYLENCVFISPGGVTASGAVIQMEGCEIYSSNSVVGSTGATFNDCDIYGAHSLSTGAAVFFTNCRVRGLGLIVASVSGANLKVVSISEIGTAPLDLSCGTILSGVQGASLTVTKYLIADRSNSYFDSVSVTAIDTPLDGYIGHWDNGGKTVSEAYASGTHGTPPVTPSVVHVTTVENTSTTPAWIKHRPELKLWCNASQALEVVVYAKQVATGFDDRATFSLELGDATIAESLTVVDSTDWQTLTLNTASLDHSQQVTLKLSVRGQSKVLYWFYVVTPPASEGGGGRPEIRGSNL